MNGLCENQTSWDQHILLNGSYPRFSKCFQDTVLIWMPCGFLWLFMPNWIAHLVSMKDVILLQKNYLHTSKIVINMIVCALAVDELITTFIFDDGMQGSSALLLNKIIKTSTTILALYVGRLESKKGIAPSGYLFLFWLLSAMSELVLVYTLTIEKVYVDDFDVYIMATVYLVLVVTIFVLQFFSDQILPEIKDEKHPCPQLYASFPSKLTFSWLNSLIYLGSKKPLSEDDLWELHPELRGENVIPKFEEIWNEEIYACKRYNKKLKKKHEAETRNQSQRVRHPSLFRAIVKFCGRDTIKGIIFRTIVDILQLCNPVLLGMLISYIQNKSTEHAWKGYALALTFYLNAVVMQLLMYFNDINVDTLMMKLKTSLVSAVYKKTLKMDNKSKKNFTAGEIVNYMSVDCGKVQGINWTFMYSVSVPLRFMVCAVLLWNTLGSAVFAGMAVMCLVIPINTVISKKEKVLNRKLTHHKDERTKLLAEVLNEIKIIKFYTWESSFQKKITNIRDKELAIRKKMWYLTSLYVLTLGLVPFLVTLFTFTIYTFYQEGNHLDAGKAFMALSLFDNLKFPLYMLPRIISRFIQERVCMERLSNFLQSGELDQEKRNKNRISPGLNIQVHNGTFSWDDTLPPALKGINLEIPHGKLYAVVGPVGAGKSSLLSMLLGEMDKVSGVVALKGSIAYVPQQAWIQNATLKDNILFGKMIDRDKYENVIEACSLKPDLEILSAGDMTEIGEKGINLSGGQKQRISLARAVYHNADIYLLDDPLSAVDSHVGKHIFDHVIGNTGLLRNKTRILVTHGVHWLPNVDGIIVMESGKIFETGTFEQLVKNNGAFVQLLRTSQVDKSREENEVIRGEEDKAEKINTLYARNRSISSFEHLEIEEIQSPASFLKICDGDNVGDDCIVDKLSENSKKDESTNFDANNFEGKKRVDKLKPDPVGQLIDEEHLGHGQVQFGVFLKYFQAYGKLWILGIIVMAIINRLFGSGTSLVISIWTEDNLLKNKTLAHSNEYKSRNIMYIALYAGCGLSETLIDIAYTLMVYSRGVVASRRLQSTMLQNVLYFPMKFFDTTPIGRILNRFTSDVDKIDNELPNQIRGVFHQVLHATTTLAIISYNTPAFIVVIIPAAILYRSIRKYFVPSARQIERIHGKTRSPVYSFFSETIAGASTIRAFGLEDKFAKESQDKVDRTVRSLYTLISVHNGMVWHAIKPGLTKPLVLFCPAPVQSRDNTTGVLIYTLWSGLRFECVGNLFVLAAALFAVMSSDISDGIAGLCVAHALQITGALNSLVNTSATLEIDAVSVERVVEYSNIESEIAGVKFDNSFDSEWPKNGNISIKDFKTRYRPGLDLVLRGINCNIVGGEKIGIVGRTGAGKSSLMSAMFRLIEATGGKVEIDGKNIASISLYDLRSKLTILPQDPVLFSGTVRMNLDPFDKFTNQIIWTALEHAHLASFVLELPLQLDYECGEKGQNLSLGQRQLLCLARALLNKTRILILDEATAAVDMETDDLIQETIRSEFRDCTIIAIAHRLRTIIDYDKVLVLEDGLVLEYDSPKNLLENKTSVFYGMAKESNLV